MVTTTNKNVGIKVFYITQYKLLVFSSAENTVRGSFYYRCPILWGI